MDGFPVTAPLRTAVLIGSTREGRVGPAIGDWFTGIVRRRSDLALDEIDVAAFDFPQAHPAGAHPQTAAFAARIADAEAFVVVTPEYNHSYPASLKQAIDYAYDEWHAKPVGLVSYGCHSRGWYAVSHLRTVFTELHAVTMREVVGVDLLADEKQLDTGSYEKTATTLLDQLTWWGLALRDARAARPYVS